MRVDLNRLMSGLLAGVAGTMEGKQAARDEAQQNAMALMQLTNQLQQTDLSRLQAFLGMAQGLAPEAQGQFISDMTRQYPSLSLEQVLRAPGNAALYQQAQAAGLLPAAGADSVPPAAGAPGAPPVSAFPAAGAPVSPFAAGLLQSLPNPFAPTPPAPPNPVEAMGHGAAEPPAPVVPSAPKPAAGRPTMTIPNVGSYPMNEGPALDAILGDLSPVYQQAQVTGDKATMGRIQALRGRIRARTISAADANAEAEAIQEAAGPPKERLGRAAKRHDEYTKKLDAAERRLPKEDMASRERIAYLRSQLPAEILGVDDIADLTAAIRAIDADPIASPPDAATVAQQARTGREGRANFEDQFRILFSPTDRDMQYTDEAIADALPQMADWEAALQKEPGGTFGWDRFKAHRRDIDRLRTLNQEAQDLEDAGDEEAAAEKREAAATLAGELRGRIAEGLSPAQERTALRSALNEIGNLSLSDAADPERVRSIFVRHHITHLYSEEQNYAGKRADAEFTRALRDVTDPNKMGKLDAKGRKLLIDLLIGAARLADREIEIPADIVIQMDPATRARVAMEGQRLKLQGRSVAVAEANLKLRQAEYALREQQIKAHGIASGWGPQQTSQAATLRQQAGRKWKEYTSFLKSSGLDAQGEFNPLSPDMSDPDQKHAASLYQQAQAADDAVMALYNRYGETGSAAGDGGMASGGAAGTGGKRYSATDPGRRLSLEEGNRFQKWLIAQGRVDRSGGLGTPQSRYDAFWRLPEKNRNDILTNPKYQ